MADAKNTVEDVERIDISGMRGGDDDSDDTNDDEGNDGSGNGNDGTGGGEGDQDDAHDDDEGEGEEGEDTGDGEGAPPAKGPKEQLVRRQPDQPNAAAGGESVAGDGDTTGLSADDLKPVPGETPRERAMRLELTKTRKLLRGERGQELLGAQAPAPVSQKKELSAEQKAVLEKYKPEELQSLQEVMPILAEQMGFVRAEQLQAGTYAEKASSELDAFLEAHTEYLPENDHGNVLWDRFKTEFALYKQPQNPKDYRRIFNKIHTEIFGIQPASEGGKGKTDAQRHKVGVASQSGSSGPVAAPRAPKSGQRNTSGLRLDMLKGFDEDELAELENEAG